MVGSNEIWDRVNSVRKIMHPGGNESYELVFGDSMRHNIYA